MELEPMNNANQNGMHGGDIDIIGFHFISWIWFVGENSKTNWYWKWGEGLNAKETLGRLKTRTHPLQF